MQIPVSELIVRYLEQLGVEVIFGMPGAHILPVYDRLYDSPIEAVLAKHEQGAAFMAGGYARVSGKVGACIATAGPGATNLITGIANAYADRQPVIAITGEAPTHLFGKGGLQESSGEGGSFDQTALFAHITRYSKTIERTDYLPQVLVQASKALFSGTPGPVLLCIPFNVQQEMVDDAILDDPRLIPRPDMAGDIPATDRLAEALLQARAPVIVAGYGCLRAGAQAEVATLSQRLGIPVATSLKGKGVIGEDDPLALGSLGVTSSGQAYKYITEQADLLLVLGAGFNERTSYLWDEALTGPRRVLQIDNDPNQLGKVFDADIAVCGDLKAVLGDLIARLGDRQPDDRDVAGAVAHSRQRANGDYSMFKSGFALAEGFFTRLAQHFPDRAVVFDDNIIFAQNFYPVASGCRYYPNSGISSLGHAIPAAIGAQFHHDRPTFAVLGDGGFQMCCMEIMTAVNYARPLNIVLFNNGTMGLIRKNQHQLYRRRFTNCDFINPDFGDLARAFGIRYQRIERTDDLDTLFREYDLGRGITLIDIVLDKNAFPTYSSKR